jgi:hypothetical protein
MTGAADPASGKRILTEAGGEACPILHSALIGQPRQSPSRRSQRQPAIGNVFSGNVLVFWERLFAPEGDYMSMILIIVVLLLLFGGGGGYYGYSRYGGRGLGGVLGTVLVVLVVLWLVGALGHGGMG